MKPNPETLVSAGKCRFAVLKFGFVKVVDYRLYGLDGVRRIASAEWFDADDDDKAIEVAKSMMDGHDCELWQGSRLVARIPHERKR